MTNIPWGVTTEENFDITAARRVLDRDHYGMDEVKETILQFIAVGKLKGSVQGKILCLAGPPGTGKVSWYTEFCVNFVCLILLKYELLYLRPQSQRVLPLR